MEVGESYFTCAERETLEEAGIEVKGEKLIGITNDIFDEKKHYITIFVSCRRVDETQEPQVCRNFTIPRGFVLLSLR